MEEETEERRRGEEEKEEEGEEQERKSRTFTRGEEKQVLLRNTSPNYRFGGVLVGGV